MNANNNNNNDDRLAASSAAADEDLTNNTTNVPPYWNFVTAEDAVAAKIGLHRQLLSFIPDWLSAASHVIHRFAYEARALPVCEIDCADGDLYYRVLVAWHVPWVDVPQPQFMHAWGNLGAEEQRALLEQHGTFARELTPNDEEEEEKKETASVVRFSENTVDNRRKAAAFINGGGSDSDSDSRRLGVLRLIDNDGDAGMYQYMPCPPQQPVPRPMMHINDVASLFFGLSVMGLLLILPCE